jgi:hypothetical protein
VRILKRHILRAALGVTSAQKCREDIRNPEPIRDKARCEGCELLRRLLSRNSQPKFKRLFKKVPFGTNSRASRTTRSGHTSMRGQPQIAKLASSKTTIAQPMINAPNSLRRPEVRVRR